MTPLETALVILISIWSLIFVIIAIFLILMIIKVQKMVNKLNHIVETTENVADGVSAPLKMVAAGIANFMKNKVKTKKTA